MAENQTCSLANRDCVPCKGGVPPLKGESLRQYQTELGGNWELIDEQRLEKTYKFKNFREALNFTVLVGELAESVGHHPDIFLTWGKVKITIHSGSESRFSGSGVNQSVYTLLLVNDFE
jgi:4a-hydroxytetrahydrobiopterin dehydratase